MPRPGPRPYECVRRAWHSDRHQPIRGSLIQEIFRIVNEVHSSATKKNKEWQEKLPVVVLRAEEIIYSKANSEAEYMDLKTLWDRTNDAINTIIRRDETTETGELLQPCIEAALNLGCTPRRATRSQRNCHPRFYLNPSNQELNPASPGAMHKAIQVDHVTNPHGLPNYANLIKPSIINSTHSGSEPQNLADQNNVSSNRYLFTTDKVPLSSFIRGLPPENHPFCSVYPLYYGRCQEAHQRFEVLPKTAPSTKEPANLMQNFFPCNEDAPVKLGQADHKDGPLHPQEIGCDLSLRLGSLSAPLQSVETKQLQFAKDREDGCPQERNKFNDWIPQMDKEFSFFTRVYMDEPLGSRSSKMSEHITVDATLKKRKAVSDHRVDDQQFCWQPKLPCNQLAGRVKTAGS